MCRFFIGAFAAVAAANLVAAPLGEDGRAEAWLVAGPWAGPAGLSLLGVDYEREVRLCEGDTVICKHFDGGSWTNWTAVARQLGIGYVIKEAPGNSVWAKSASYGAIWVVSDAERTVRLDVTQPGFATVLFANGRKIDPVSSRRTGAKKVKSSDVTDQGNAVEESYVLGGLESQFDVPLVQGANRLLVKIVRQDKGEEPLAFDAVFADGTGLSFSTMDPETDPEKHAVLANTWAKVDVSAVANLPHPGDALSVTTAINFPWRPNGRAKKGNPAPLPQTLPPFCPFDAIVEQRVTDWDGREVARIEYPVTVPGTNTAALCTAGEPGYYAIHTTVKDTEGRILFVYPADGFSVIPEAAADARPLPRKIATCFYWIGGKGHPNELILDWMDRMNIRHNVGGNIASTNLFEQVSARGLSLTADFLDPWSNVKPENKRAAAEMAAGYTRLFKAWNEIDICREQWRGKDGAKWTQRTKLEYDIVHSVRPDAIYTGGSLVRPAQSDWFDSCLTNGLYDCTDVWDVHAYPRDAPRFGKRHVSNSLSESGPGVEACIRRTLGRENGKPFIMGEWGARCSHGWDARRWQADMVAKMAGWGVSATNYLQVAFLVPWIKANSGGDIPVAHYPAEAALFTAANLIDGFPAEEVPGVPPTVEARRFGRTVMMWARGSKPQTVVLPAKEGAAYALIDVVGRKRGIAPQDDGFLRLELTSSPVYLVEEDPGK